MFRRTGRMYVIDVLESEKTASHAGPSIKEYLMKALARHDVATIPEVLIEILRMSRNAKADANDLANLCKRDLATTTRLLKAANSVYYARRLDQPRVNNLKDAIVRIGFKRSQEIVMSASLSCIMLMHDSIMDYSSINLWKHCIAVGIGNRIIHNHKFGSQQSQDPYLAGLMHDLGIAIEHQALFSCGFSEAVQNRYVRGSELIHEERAILHTTHEEVGKWVAQQWNFPDYLVSVIGHHHSFDPSQHQHHHLFHVNRISEWICFFLNIGYSDFSKPVADALAESRVALGLKMEEIEGISAQVRAEIEALNMIGWFSATPAAGP